MLTWIQNIDWMVLHWMRGTLQCGVLDFLMPKITVLGNMVGRSGSLQRL